MKLDKIRFATLIGYLSRITHQTFAIDEIVEIDSIINFQAPPAPMMNAETLHVLLALMQDGTKKIEAIKQHRMMTGYGLKESKDIIEKYWYHRPVPTRADMEKYLDNNTTMHIDDIATVRKFLEKFKEPATLGDILNKATNNN